MFLLLQFLYCISFPYHINLGRLHMFTYFHLRRPRNMVLYGPQTILWCLVFPGSGLPGLTTVHQFGFFFGQVVVEKRLGYFHVHLMWMKLSVTFALRAAAAHNVSKHGSQGVFPAPEV